VSAIQQDRGVKGTGIALLIGGLLVAGACAFYAYVNLTTGIGPLGGHAGLGSKTAVVVFTIAGMSAAIVGAVFIALSTLRRKRDAQNSTR
jgi:hypothetical protein